jgi:hypothetical protein
VAARLNSVWPDGAVSRVSFTVLNLCHRDGHEAPMPLTPGERYRVRLKLDDVAVRIPEGHRLRIAISTCYWPMIWPAPETVTLSLHTQESHVDIPVRGRKPDDAAPHFEPAEGAPPLKRKTLSKPFNSRKVTIDQASGETQLEIIDDFGSHELPGHGLRTSERAHEIYSIMSGDPLSAKHEIHWSEELARGRWKVRTETHSQLTATREHWVIEGKIEAFEGRRKIFTKRLHEKIKRQLG